MKTKKLCVSRDYLFIKKQFFIEFCFFQEGITYIYALYIDCWSINIF